MNSVFAQLFLAIQNHLKDVLPTIRQVDQDLGQLDYYPEDGRPNVSWPCLLLDFDATADELGDGVQWLSINVNCRLAFSPYSSAASFVPDIVREKALEFYEVELQLYQALQGFDAGGIVQPLSRMGAIITEKREDPFRVRQMTFTTATQDFSAQHPHNMLQVPGEYSGEFIPNDEPPLPG